MPVHDIFLLRRFPCRSGIRGQRPNIMAQFELRTINVSRHKLIEFLPDK